MRPTDRRRIPSLELLEDRVVPYATYLGDALLVNTTTSGTQDNPAVAMDATGDYVVVWEYNGPGIIARRFDAAGVPQGDEFSVHSQTPTGEADPAVAMDAAGNFVVAWFGRAGENRVVRAQLWAADGTPVGSEILVATLTASPFDPRPSVAMTPTGFVVAWDANDSAIHFKRYDASGNLLGEVSHAVGRPVEAPRVGADAAGNLAVAYADDLEAGTIYARRFDPAGLAQGGEIVVIPDATNRTPEIAVEADGDFVVAWAGAAEGIFARLYAADGTARTDALRLDSPLTAGESEPTVGVDAAGNFVVAWQVGGDIHAIRGSAAGFTYGSSFLVNLVAVDTQSNPSVAVSAGQFVVAWQTAGTTLGREVYAQRFATGPNHAPVLDASADPTFVYVAQNAADPHGDTVASLLGTSVTDADLGALQGVAVVGLTGTSDGTWEFSTDDGTTWAPVGAASESAARLLRASDLLRFAPNAGFLGTATVTYRAWDWTQGTFGGTADLTVLGTGGATAFSTVTETATLTVTPTGNHGPILNNLGSPTFTHVPVDRVTPGNSVAELVGATITDRNHDALEGIAVVGLTGAEGGTWEYSTNGGFSWTPVGLVAPTFALLLRDIDRLRFLPNAGFLGTVSITYHAWDQTAGSPGGRFHTTPIDGVNGPFSAAQETATLIVARFHLAGNVLNIYGTPGDDLFSHVPGVVSLNGVSWAYTTSTTIIFDGWAGTDIASVNMTSTLSGIFTGGNPNQVPMQWGRADLYEDYARINKNSIAGRYDLTLSDVENIFLSTGGGDVVNLYDSAGDDTFVSGPAYAYLTTPNSYFVVSGAGNWPGFPNPRGSISAHSRYGTDTAWFYDSYRDDTFTANAATGTASMSQLQMVNNFGYGFETVRALVTGGGADTVYFYDGLYDDYFVGGAASSTLVGPGYSYQVDGFDLILAQAIVGGVDLALILDPSRNIASGFRFL